MGRPANINFRNAKEGDPKLAGKLRLDLLDQDKIWIDQEGVTWKLYQMGDAHIHRLLRFLKKQASNLSLQYGFHVAMQIDRWEAAFGAPDDYDIPDHTDTLMQLEHELAMNGRPHSMYAVDREWMYRTPLYQGLLREQRRRRLPRIGISI